MYVSKANLNFNIHILCLSEYSMWPPNEFKYITGILMSLNSTKYLPRKTHGIWTALGGFLLPLCFDIKEFNAFIRFVALTILLLFLYRSI